MTPSSLAFRYADVPMVLMALPIVLIGGAPALGVLVGAAAWIAQRVLQFVIERATERTDNFSRQTGLRLGGIFLRAWLTALAIIVVGSAGEREDGLAAAILIAAAFTVAFAVSLAFRPHPPEGTS